MAPQAAPQNPAKLTPEQIAAENAEARFGADEDALIERGQTEDVHQGAGDPADTGVVRREPIQRSPHDDKRASIAARFRRDEPDGERPFNGDFADSENIVGRVAQNDADDSDDDLADMGLSPEEIARARGKSAGAEQDDDDESLIEPQPRQQEQQPQRRPVKVNGKTLMLTDQEILDRASKVSAADDYFEQAKELLREAKALRSGQPGRHAGENNGADTADLGTDPVDVDVQNPEPSTRSVIEKIQFGDPDEAAAELDRLVDHRAGKKATEGQLQRVIKQDLARSQKQLKEFADANKELNNNRVAALAIEDGMYRGYREDIAALGVAEDQIPSNPNDLAHWHRFYRVNGYDVRSTRDLLESSKKEFLQSIGQFGGRRQQQPPSRQPAARVQVNVDRDQRRMAIPTQPTRSVAPRRDVQPQNRPQTGSDVVNQMRRQRGQPVV